LRTLVADASVLLAFYLPAEPYKQAAMTVLKAFTEGKVRLVVPALTPYEVLNGLVRSVRGLRTGRRLPLEEALAILQAFLALRLETVTVEGMEAEVLRVAAQCGCSAYDAAYLVLAEQHGWELVTGDERFFQAVSGTFRSIRRIEDIAGEFE
jgi:predicted nucleic acid-binding protein